MAKKRRYHPLVVEELLAATSHYDEISSNFGNRYRDGIRERLKVITIRPDSFAMIHDDMRGTLVHRISRHYHFRK